MLNTEATQYIKATLAVFGPGEAIIMTQSTWAKLHEAMSVLVEQPAPVPLTDGQIDELVGEVVESAAKERGLHVDNLNTDITTQHYLRRAIVRAAHGIK